MKKNIRMISINGGEKSRSPYKRHRTDSTKSELTMFFCGSEHKTVTHAAVLFHMIADHIAEYVSYEKKF